MYTILLEPNKKILTTVSRVTLYQRESLVDKLQFILPQKYGDIDLSADNCQIVLKYTDPANNSYAVCLVKDKDLYKENYIRCELPIDISLTRFAGNITLYISVMDLNIEDSIEAEILHTNGVTITITPLDDIFGFVPNESFQKLDQEILKLQAIGKANTLLLESIDQNKADDLSYEDNTLSLMANGKKIGTSHTLDQQKEFNLVEFSGSDSDNDQNDSNNGNDTFTFVKF